MQTTNTGSIQIQSTRENTPQIGIDYLACVLIGVAIGYTLYHIAAKTMASRIIGTYSTRTQI